MAKATRRKTRVKKTTRSKRKKKAQPFEPATEPSEPLENIGDYLIWLYGKPKIGKTTLAAEFPDSYFLMGEDGAKALSVYQSRIREWGEVGKAMEWWQRQEDFKTGVVDVVEKFYTMAATFVGDRDGFEKPEWGQWADIAKEFTHGMLQLSAPSKGALYLSHVSIKSRKNMEGEEIEDAHPAGLPGSALEAFMGEMDIIAYYTFVHGQRVLQVRGDDEVTAGCRVPDSFMFDDETQMKYVPMGDSAEESYANFMKGFECGFKRSEVEALLERKEPAKRKGRTRRRKKSVRR